MMKKTMAIVLALLLILTAALACAQTVKKDGLQVTLTTDKQAYAAGETINLTLTVKNAGSAVVKGVYAQFAMPEGCEAAQGVTPAGEIGMLEAGKQATLKAAYVVKAGEDTPELPNTGDESKLLVWAALLCISGLAFAKLSRRAQRRMMALLLCAVTAGSVMLCGIDAASAEGKPLTVKFLEETTPEACRRMYDIVMRKAGTMQDLRAQTSCITVSETVEIAGKEQEIFVKVEYAVPQVKASGYSSLYADIIGRPLDETVDSALVVYNETLGDPIPMETQSGYSKFLDQIHMLTSSEAVQGITLIFDYFCFEDENDCMLVYDGEGRYAGCYSSMELMGGMVTVPGNCIYLRVLTSEDDYDYSFHVEKAVAHGKPAITSAKTDGSGYVNLKWTTSEGNDGFELWRRRVDENANEPYAKIKTKADGAVTEYKDNTTTAGVLYQYFYREVFSADGTSYYWFPTNSNVAEVCTLERTALISGQGGTSGGVPQITLTWNAVPGATHYKVFRCATKDGSFALVGMANGTSYTDPLPAEGSYYYSILPCMTIRGKEYKGVYSAKVQYSSNTVASIPAPTSLTGRSTGVSGVKLQWTSNVSGATFEVYGCATQNGTYTKMATTTAKSAGVSAKVRNAVNYYKVRAYVTQNGQKVYSPFSSVFKIWPLSWPTNLRLTADSKGNAILNWDKVANATGYTVYYSTKQASGYVKYRTTTDTRVWLSGLPGNLNTAYVKVVANRNAGGVSSASRDSAVLNARLKVPAPTNVTNSSKSGSEVNVKWTAASGVTGYEVYVSDGSGYVKKGETTATNLTVPVVTTGKVNWIKVRSYADLNGSRQYSPMTAAIKCFPLAKPTISSAALNSAGKVVVKWGAVANATRYGVYYADPADGVYRRYGGTTGKQMTLSNLPESINTVYVKVVAEKVSGSDVFKSEYSAAVSCRINYGDTITLRLSEAYPAGHPAALADERFAALVEQKTDGRIKVEVYTDGALYYDESTALEAMQLGDLAFARVPSAVLTEYSPKMTALQLPCIFKNDAHMWGTLDGSIGQGMLNDLQTCGSGLVGLAWYDMGAQIVVGFYPIDELEDFEDIDISVARTALMVDTVSVLGACAVTGISKSDWLLGFAAGVISGVVGSIPESYDVLNGSSFYYSQCPLVHAPDILLASETVLLELAQADIDIILECAAQAQAYEKTVWAEQEAEIKQQLVATDSKCFVEPSASFIAELRAAMTTPSDVLGGVSVYEKHGSGCQSTINAIKALESNY